MTTKRPIDTSTRRPLSKRGIARQQDGFRERCRERR